MAVFIMWFMGSGKRNCRLQSLQQRVVCARFRAARTWSVRLGLRLGLVMGLVQMLGAGGGSSGRGLPRERAVSIAVGAVCGC